MEAFDELIDTLKSQFDVSAKSLVEKDLERRPFSGSPASRLSISALAKGMWGGRAVRSEKRPRDGIGDAPTEDC